jgi:ubiquinone/menaquinone biosynthesis C-methylase UbiE
MTESWKERYSREEYIYGEAPNVFFEDQLKQLKPGKLLLPCEGEGRNAVYAVSAGWDVVAFDASAEGAAKAMNLAQRKNVAFEYIVADASTIAFPENSFDAIAFIFAHFPPAIRTDIHRKAMKWLKPGGAIILEAFTPLQLSNKSGGPKDIAMLYTGEILRSDFEGMNITWLKGVEALLDEGNYHQGKADTVQFLGIKPGSARAAE